MDSRIRTFRALGREPVDRIPIDFWASDAMIRRIEVETGLPYGAFLDRHDIDLRYIRDPKGRISDSYGVKTLPNMFIVDVDGKVAHVHRGYSEEMIDGFIQEMLALLPPEALAKPANQ